MAAKKLDGCMQSICSGSTPSAPSKLNASYEGRTWCYDSVWLQIPSFHFMKGLATSIPLSQGNFL
ncbi:hypothetical protein J3E68DRAFT_396528 [Trichoderma sp. SZMC 28012]